MTNIEKKEKEINIPRKGERKPIRDRHIKIILRIGKNKGTGFGGRN